MPDKKTARRRTGEPAPKVVRLSAIKKNPDNPRQIRGEQFERLKKSIKEFPEMMSLRPIVTDADGVTLGGNMRLEALKALGYKEIPAEWVKRADQLTPEQRREFVIKDNAGFGEWEWDLLSASWSDLPLNEWGVDLQADWLAQDGRANDESIEADALTNKAQELQQKWQTAPGQLWTLGRHRLICGDCTDGATVKRLMQGERADLYITDPPYNINFAAQRNSRSYEATSDDLSNDEYLSLLSAAYLTANEFCEKAIVTCGKQNLKMWLTHFDVTEIGVWVAKNKMSGGRVSHLSLWEPVLFLGKFERGSRSTDLFEFNTKFQDDADGHPCPKVLEFWVELLKCFSTETVYDSFGGSGTTLIACEQLGRNGRAAEISAEYVAVALERWFLLTGERPTLAEG